MAPAVPDWPVGLEAETLADGSVFQNRKIPGGEAGTDVSVAAHVAVKAAVRGRSEEGGGIEPLIGIAEDDRAGEIRIKEWAHRIARIAVVGGVVAELRGKGKAGLHGENAGDGPAAD